MVTSFAPLVLRSDCSLLAGASSVERIVERARELHLPAIALTDTNNLYGAVPFYKLAREAEIKPVVGAEIRSGSLRAVLLARDLAGYRSLCKIITRRHLDDDFSLPACLMEFHEGLHILTEDVALAEKLAGRLDRDRLHLMLIYPGRTSAQWRTICRKAGEIGVGAVATPDVHFLDPEEYEIHRALTAIRENTLLSRLSPQDLAHPHSYLAPPERMASLFQDYPEALANARRVIEDCNLEIPLRRPIFPRYPLPAGETPQGFLSRLCREGLRSRCHPAPPAYTERLRHELEIIQKLGFTEYFIFVWDILSFARRKGIPTIGRGSGASSIVSYALGITQVDPIKYDIPFERFLHTQRSDCPDLDVDLCWIKRDRLIESVYEKYGASKVAMVSTHVCFRLRSAFREVAKAFGVPNEIVNRMSRRLPYESKRPLRDLAREAGVQEHLSLDEEAFARIVSVAERIRGCPRHLGIHCGGLVIGDGPLDGYVPLERAAKGIVITQYEKDAIEEIGLVKMDLLGNHGLTIRDEAVRLVAESRGVRLDMDGIPDPDPETADLLRNARTISCCQLESPAMRNLLKMLQAVSVKEVMQALALVRPAPASCGMKERFIRRARGLEPWRFSHPALKDALRDSYGIMLYEDDAMLVASALGGFSVEEGDLLRRAISKSRSRDRLLEISRRFLEKAAANGVPIKIAREMWLQMAKFTSYSFCKAHAASYAKVAYQLAYLKAHYPLEFMAAVLNHHWGMYPKRVHLEEARRLGIRVLGPCVNRSAAEFTIEDGCIRIGLSQVKDLSERTIGAICKQRPEEPFRSLNDFLGRVKISEPKAESLILCGAFDFTGRIRPQLIWQLKTAFPILRQHTGKGSLIRAEPELPEPPPLRDYSPLQRLAYESSVLGMSPQEHIMAILRPMLRKRGILDSRTLSEMVEKDVRIGGTLAAFRPTSTRRNGQMEFLTLEDEVGVFEVTLFPQAYRKSGQLIDGYGPYVAQGRVEDRYGALSVSARSVTRLDLGQFASAQDKTQASAEARPLSCPAAD